MSYLGRRPSTHVDCARGRPRDSRGVPRSKNDVIVATWSTLAIATRILTKGWLNEGNRRLATTVQFIFLRRTIARLGRVFQSYVPYLRRANQMAGLESSALGFEADLPASALWRRGRVYGAALDTDAPPRPLGRVRHARTPRDTPPRHAAATTTRPHLHLATAGRGAFEEHAETAGCHLEHPPLEGKVGRTVDLGI